MIMKNMVKYFKQKECQKVHFLTLWKSF